MVKIPANIIDIIHRFVDEAEKEKIHIQQAILFGSYATGNYHKYNDIDLAVISDEFEGIRLFDNIKLDRPVLRSSYDLETHPFRPEDFTEDNPFVKEILKNGIRVV
ncbi:MAG: nucleotidyltransferase domain-containing protein [Ignavibacteriae bacterium]|nr:nucleotidyltransferase domain-containing protein [Ignavibacteriota bacterium]